MIYPVRGRLDVPTVDAVKVLHAMQTPDGRWRVEVIQHGAKVQYQLVHDGVTIEWLSIGTVERILRDAGVDMADLVEVQPWQSLAGPATQGAT